MNKFILCFFILFTLVSCRDQVTSKNPKKEVIQNTALCEEEPTTGNPGNACIPSSIEFTGISDITNVKEKEVTINWSPVAGLVTYHVFQWVQNEKKYLKTARANSNQTVIEGLTPDTEYAFIVNAMDESGKLENNMNIVSTKTLNHPPYANSKSVYLNGTKSIDLTKSNVLFPNKNKFSVSLWFKTNFIQLDSYLISAHYGVANGISFAIGMNQSKFLVDLRDESGEFKRTEFDYLYNDNQWHQVVVTFNENRLQIFIDGVLKKSVNDTIVGFGDAIARIGSFNGSSRFFAGHIDEVAIWKRPLNTNQVSSVYNNGSASDLLLNLNSNAVAHWWRLGDLNDSISLFIDQISNANAQGRGLINTDIVSDAP